MKARRRHIAKTITWRIIASLTTFILTLFFFKEDPNATEKAVNVAIIESILKMLFYYLHERFWYNLKLSISSRFRHLLKAITWRFIASITTFAIAFVIFNSDPYAIEKASGIAIIESFLKMILYYFHERIWYHQDLGLNYRGKKIEEK